ncbi:MAG TPA: TetR/AcrR family transcriptional regulator [Solirubrobacterales bacterium]|nr:TetR/AcrR family transcriptional regulator [Solirubrobacterales bacterium]
MPKTATNEAKLPFKPRMKREERRAVIEEAASRLIAERGYDAASLEDIAAAAGVSKAVLYDHFASKAELQISLLSSASDALMRFVAERLGAAEGGPGERYRAAIEAFYEFVETNEFAWRMIFRDPPSDPVVLAACLEMRRNVTLGIAAMMRTQTEVATRVEAGEPYRLEMLAEQLKMAMAGLASWWYEHRELSREQIVAAHMELTWLGMERMATGERWSPESR